MTTARVLPGIAQAIVGEAKRIAELPPNLTALSNIEISFSPWNPNSISTKQVWRKLCSEECRNTNRFCTIKSTVEHNTSDPSVLLSFNDQSKLRLIGTHLKTLEMMYYINKFCMDKDQVTVDEPKVLF